MSKLLDEADILQQKTKQSLNKINSNINDIDNIASLTLEELRSNSEQIDNTINQINVINKNLDISERLKNKFNMLNGKFFNFNLFRTKNKEYDNNLKNVNSNTSNINSNKTNTNTNNNSNIKFISNSKFDNVCVDVDNDNLASRLNKINNNDVQIDNELDNISNSLDKIMEKSKLMNEEVIQQNNKLDVLDFNINNVEAKQDKINDNLKKILRKK